MFADRLLEPDKLLIFSQQAAYDPLNVPSLSSVCTNPFLHVSSASLNVFEQFKGLRRETFSVSRNGNDANCSPAVILAER